MIIRGGLGSRKSEFFMIEEVGTRDDVFFDIDLMLACERGDLL